MKTNRFVPLGLVFIGILFVAAQSFAQPNSQLSPEYSKWLNEDVHWIITTQERAQFLDLRTDQARDAFVVSFWEKRNPTPGSRENSFKEEHYRRLAFANEHFASSVPGWKTDRGHIYIVYGPPDEIVSKTGNEPSQTWSYPNQRTEKGERSFTFVDSCRCGDYRLQP